MKQRFWRLYLDAIDLRERLLRGVRPRRMRFVAHSWPLRPATCPCDVEFVDWLAIREIRHRAIFHMGTGGHHLVGRRNHEAGWSNDILGLTLAPRELRTYMRTVIRDPALGRHYKVLFADLHSLSEAALPCFDIVTLFHLAEFADAASPARRLDEAGVLRLFIARTVAGGLLLFYRGSFGHARIAPLIEARVADGTLQAVEEFGSLAVFRVVDPARAGR